MPKLSTLCITGKLECWRHCSFEFPFQNRILQITKSVKFTNQCQHQLSITGSKCKLVESVLLSSLYKDSSLFWLNYLQIFPDNDLFHLLGVLLDKFSSSLFSHSTKSMRTTFLGTVIIWYMTATRLSSIISFQKELIR